MQARPVLAKLVVDCGESLVRVAGADVDHVDEQLGTLEVGEKLVPEPDSLACALDQPRHVGDDQLPPVRCVHRPEDRGQRRERVLGDLRLRVRDAANQRRLAGVRQADERSVGEQLEP